MGQILFAAFRFAGLLCAVLWCLILRNSDSYYIVYLLTAAAGFVCCGFTHSRHFDLHSLSRLHRWLTRVFALVFSLVVYLANGPQFDPVTGTIRPATPFLLLLALIFLLGGYWLFREIFGFLAVCAQRSSPRFRQTSPESARWILLVSWAVLAALYSLVLYLCYYPGVTTYDSINQLEQLLGLRAFSNHHPYYHTRFVGLLFGLGMNLFGNIDAAVALFSQFSILVMAGVFSYSVYTLYEATGSKPLSLILFGFYALMPYHILYSFALWKDVFFAASVTGFVVSLFRCVLSIGQHPRGNLLGIVLSATLMCVFRSNGLFAFAVSLMVFLPLFFREKKGLCLTLCGVCLCSYLLTGPVLKTQNIPQPRITESLSIPLQQVAQVIKDDCPLTPEQTLLLERCVDLEAVKEEFLPYISDPVKALVDSGPFQEQGTDYIRLYLQLGISYPLKYIQAWINQTKGYWNGGYKYWRFPAPYPNELGVSMEPPNPAAKALFVAYEKLFENTAILQPLLSIGLFVWLLVFCGFVALQKKDKVLFFLVVPFLAVILSLLIATPVFSEFRYSYSVFCGGPFVFGLTLHALWGKEKGGKTPESCFKRFV